MSLELPGGSAEAMALDVEDSWNKSKQVCMHLHLLIRALMKLHCKLHLLPSMRPGQCMLQNACIVYAGHTGALYYECISVLIPFLLLLHSGEAHFGSRHTRTLQHTSQSGVWPAACSGGQLQQSGQLEC